MADIADELGLGEQQVRNELKRYNDAELVAEVRNKLLATLEKTATIYETVLTTSPETLTKHARGYKLQVDVANAMNEGLGTFKRESSKTVKSTLEMIATEVAAPEAKWGEDAQGNRLRPRVAFQPDVIDAETTEASDVTGAPV